VNLFGNYEYFVGIQGEANEVHPGNMLEGKEELDNETY